MTAISQQSRGVKLSTPTKAQLLTIGDLENFKEEMLTEIKRIVKESGGQPGKKWLKSCEVKSLLNISHGFPQTLRDTGALPFTKIGGAIYYDYEDITAMMAAKKSNKEDRFA